MGWRKWQSGIVSEYLTVSLSLTSNLYCIKSLHVRVPVYLPQLYRLMQQNSYLSYLLLYPNLTSILSLS